MTKETVGIILGLLVWAGTCYFWWRDFRREHASVQFITGRFSEFPRETRPKGYWIITILRGVIAVLFNLVLGWWALESI